MYKLKLTDLSLTHERVLMRVDFNVPLNKEGTIANDARIIAALPSIRYVLDHGASLILMSHLGRPEGKIDPKASLAPCAERLAQLLNRPVLFAPDCVGPQVEEMASKLAFGSVLLLENVRFHRGEEHPEQEPNFVKNLAKLGTIYINDAFGTAHRAHASTALITHYFPHKSAMGLLIEKELSHLKPLLTHPKRPFYALIGGAKISSKAGVLKNLFPKIDALFIGGAMAFAFLKAQAISIGDSLCESKDVTTAEELLKLAAKLHLSIHLPLDFMASKDHAAPTVFSSGIPNGWKGMDIGPATIAEWTKAFKNASTLFWNGPLGVFEHPPFDTGTKAIARTLSHSLAQVIIGGGETVAAIEDMGLSSKFSHLSTGGGASLEFLEFGHLPGIDALSDK
jgi:phosphoglycerate kinase